eukprot:GEMP01026781.1.p1 GENE.GEMP01026781.1~~GEMP01026781.1.p1  ORF type:complete len:362 (+),score=54.73 GEMP01026781.1:250-1335(+)
MSPGVDERLQRLAKEVENVDINGREFNIHQMLEEWEFLHMLVSICIAVAVVVLIQHSKAITQKGLLYTSAFLYMVLAQDTKIQKPKSGPLTGRQSKVTLVFVRHGESTWNEVFNKKPIFKMPLRLFRALIEEAKLLGEPQGSVFLDAPLNAEGISQAQKIDQFIRSPKAGEYRDALQNGALVTSNLRRALETCLLGFKSRLSSNPSTRVTMWSCLQECSRNIDTQSITPASTQPVPSVQIALADPKVADWHSSVISINEYHGNKDLSSNAGIRILEFCDKAINSKHKCIIVAGHSLWFRSFFKMMIRTGLESDLAKKATTKKIQNGGIVFLELTQYQEAGKTMEYVVDPASIKEVYLGFCS